jgi:hypothetical protein
VRLSLDDALALSRTLAALLVVLQTLELLAVRRTLAPGGVFGPGFAADDQATLPRVLSAALLPTRGYRSFMGILSARLLLAAAWWFEAAWGMGPLGSVMVAAALLLTQLAISVRFGGSFNGGSDGMSLVVLLGLFVAALPFESAGIVGLGYIAAQSTLSYLIAGLVKIREPDWRSGRALTAFLHARRYGVDPQIRAWLAQPTLARALSWAVMLFECAFPAALSSPTWMCVATGLGLAFHLGNWWVFGLNRFVWAWAATYPALVFAAGLVARA